MQGTKRPLEDNYDETFSQMVDLKEKFGILIRRLRSYDYELAARDEQIEGLTKKMDLARKQVVEDRKGANPTHTRVQCRECPMWLDVEDINDWAGEDNRFDESWDWDHYGWMCGDCP